MSERIKLTREDLYRKVWEKPTVKVAADFGISDVALAKICRKMDVPKPPPGYWRRIETGNAAPPQPALPKASEKTTEALFLNVPAADGSGRVSEHVQEKIDREALPENLILISESLTDPHPLVARTKRFLESKTPAPGETVSIPAGKGLLNISATPEQTNRALRIFDALLKACEKRGYEIKVSTDRRGEETRVIKEGEEVRISLYESFRKIRRELTPEEKKKPPYLLTKQPEEYEATGKLSIRINYRWSDYQKWSDRQKEPLEDRLNEIMAGIVAILESLVEQRHEEEEREQRRREAIRKKEEEMERREKLAADVREWRKSEDINKYLDAYEARLIRERGADTAGSPEAEWLAWARNYAAGINPLNKIFSNRDE